MEMKLYFKSNLQGFQIGIVVQNLNLTKSKHQTNKYNTRENKDKKNSDNVFINTVHRRVFTKY